MKEKKNRDAQGFYTCPVDDKPCFQSNCYHAVGRQTYCGNREEKSPPVPSEQEKQEDAAVRFAMYMTGKTTAGDQDWFRICFKNGNWKKHNIDN